MTGQHTGLDVVWQEVVRQAGQRDVLYPHGEVLHPEADPWLVLERRLVAVVRSVLVSHGWHSKVLNLLSIKFWSLSDHIAVLVVLLVILLYLVHQLLEGQVLFDQVFLDILVHVRGINITKFEYFNCSFGIEFSVGFSVYGLLVYLLRFTGTVGLNFGFV